MNARQPRQLPAVWIVSIHDRDPQGRLAFDLREVLAALGPSVEHLMWAVTAWDAIGEGDQSLDTELQEARERDLKAIWLSGKVLLSVAERITQTIDATLIAAPMDVLGASSTEELNAVLDVAHLPETRAQLVIEAVDSAFFEVMTKHRKQVRALKSRFKDVRDGDPERYLLDRHDGRVATT
jgi:hypothetical protein